MKKGLLSIICLMCVILSFAQTLQDVVYLKNGSIVRGTIAELKSNKSLTITTVDGSVFAFDMDEVSRTDKEEGSALMPAAPPKSPVVAGLLSFVCPGAGQLYNGHTFRGIFDICESVGAVSMMYIGKNMASKNYVDNATVQNSKVVAGNCMILGGLAWWATNGVISIVHAVKGAKTVNRENGYAMFDVGNGVSAGFCPTLTYEHFEYACPMPGSLNTGMSFRIAF